VLVGEDGSVENRVVATPAGMPASTLIEASNYLNAHVLGRTLAEARADIENARETARGELDALASRLVDAGLASWAGVGETRQQLIVRGQANLIGNLRAEDDLERIRLLVRRSRDPDRRHRSAASRGGRRGREDLHRIGKQAVFALGLVDDRRAVARGRSARRRRARGHRPDAAQLRANRAHGRIRRAGARRPQASAVSGRRGQVDARAERVRREAPHEAGAAEAETTRSKTASTSGL
jgi:hypothetical protein